MNRGYDWRLGKVRSIATDGKVIYDTALPKFRLSDAFEHTYDPLLNTLGTLLNQTEVINIITEDGKLIITEDNKNVISEALPFLITEDGKFLITENNLQII